MLQIVYCIFLLLPLVGLGVGGFYVSTTVGVIGAIISAVLSIPLVLSLLAHWDMLKMQSRYELTDLEMKSFVRLVPRLISEEGLAGVPPKQAKQRAKEKAVKIIRNNRLNAN